jgi:hypothetical protein
MSMTTIRIEEDDFFSYFEVSEEDQANGPKQDDEIPPGTSEDLIWSVFDGDEDNESIIRSGYFAEAWGYWLSSKPVPEGEEYELVCTADRDPAEEGFVAILFMVNEYMVSGPFSTRGIAQERLASVQAEHPMEGWVLTKAQWDEICATLPPGGREGHLRDLAEGKDS